MSIVYCHYCDKHIDTDIDAEHFLEGGDFECVEERPEHYVEYIEDHGWSDFCSCGNDTFICQVCGKAKCLTQYGRKNNKNTCLSCGGVRE